MIIRILSCALVFTLATTAVSQPAIIDTNAKSRPFTGADFDALVKCSLEKHPETTKRYATYHLQRRDRQTWQENEKDQDSDLLMPSLAGCIVFGNGEPVPFSFDALIYRWAAAHSVSEKAK